MGFSFVFHADILAISVVSTSNAFNLFIVHPIWSYQTRSTQAVLCTILEAACACIASLEIFLQVNIGSGNEKITLIEALAVAANPGNELLRERVFGDDGELPTIVSIGAGKRRLEYVDHEWLGAEGGTETGRDELRAGP
jgi:hypothetical protein